jgi:hypothetical protein
MGCFTLFYSRAFAAGAFEPVSLSCWYPTRKAAKELVLRGRKSAFEGVTERLELPHDDYH